MSERWPTLLPVLRDVIAPPPPGPIWEWAERTLRFTGTQNADHAGQPYSINRTPHTRIIFDFLADPTARELHILKSSAAAFSTAIIVGICWHLRFKPCRVLYCLNSEKEMKSMSRTVIQPFLRQTFGDAVINDPDQSNLFFEFPNGSALHLGNPTEGFFANKQASIVVLDEYDLYPDQLEGGVTDPLSAARGRFKGGTRFAKLFTLTAPQRAFDETRKDQLQPGTKQHRAYLAGSRMEFQIPCPHCDQPFTPNRSRLHFEHMRRLGVLDEAGQPIAPQDAPYDIRRVHKHTALQCPSCQGLIVEGKGPKDKAALVRLGTWRPTHTDAPPDRWSAQYNDTCALIGNSSLGTLAGELIDAKKRGRHELVQVHRARFAEPESDEEIADLSSGHVRKHCGTHRRGTCPVVPWFIVLAIDCQKGPSETQPIYFKWMLVAFMDNGDAYVINYGQTASVTELRLMYDQPIQYSGPASAIPPEHAKAGTVQFFCQRAVIDSGYRAGADIAMEESFETHVYPLCVSWGWRNDGRWIPAAAGGWSYTGTWHLVPMKGRSREQIRQEATAFSTATVPHPQYGQVEMPLHLFNDWWFKDELYRGTLAADPTNSDDPRLKRYPRVFLPAPEDNLDEQMLAEITSERYGLRPKKIRGKFMMVHEWYVPARQKNDLGDCLKMARVTWSLMAKGAMAPKAA